jgi:hypothetical protein
MATDIHNTPTFVRGGTQKADSAYHGSGVVSAFCNFFVCAWGRFKKLFTRKTKARQTSITHQGVALPATVAQPAEAVLAPVDSCVACEDHPAPLEMHYQEPMTLLDPDEALLASKEF